MLKAARAYMENLATDIAQQEPAPQFTPPREDESQWPAVRNYLTQQRGLP